MGTTLATLSHDLKKIAGGSFQSLGHVHQVLAAALGYKSFAAYKASTEEQPDYAEAKHVLVACDLVKERLTALGYPAAPEVADAVIAAITVTFQQQLPGVQVHESISDVGSAVSSFVESEIEDSGEYSGELATTNAYGGYFDLGFDAPTSIDTPTSEWVLEASGSSSLDQDPDAVFHGDVIDVRATVLFPKIGRRVLGQPEVTDTGARLQSPEPDFDGQPEPDWTP